MNATEYENMAKNLMHVLDGDEPSVARVMAALISAQSSEKQQKAEHEHQLARQKAEYAHQAARQKAEYAHQAAMQKLAMGLHEPQG